MDEHPQRSLIEAPTLLDHPRGFTADALQHAEVSLVEIAQASYSPVEGDRDEVQRAECSEVPFHVWEHQVAVLGRGIAVQDLLRLRSAVEDIFHPECRAHEINARAR